MKIKVHLTKEDIKKVITACKKAIETQKNYPRYEQCECCSMENECTILRIIQQNCNFQYEYDPTNLNEERIEEILKQSEKEIKL